MISICAQFNSRKAALILLLAMVLVLMFLPVRTASAATLEDLVVAADSVWILLAAFLVFFMHAGFAMVETGFTRAKNAGNIIMKNFMTFSMGSISYTLIGFTLMFGLTAAGFVGFSGNSLTDDFTHLGLDVPIYVFLIFQTVFAATAATIVSGAVAERIKFPGYLLYSVVLTAIIYPVVGHWVWGGGFLEELGFIDFAGSTVVHGTGGIAAFMGAYFLGARAGKYNEDGSVNAIPGHSITLGALGVLILWFGWFGFNGGSTLSALDPDMGLVVVNTNLSAAAGAILAMTVTWLKYGKPDVSMTLNGALAGLVSITAGCGNLSPLGAIIAGAIGGIILVFSVEIIDKKIKVDDPVGAVSVHGTCGIWGTLAVGFLATDGGLFYGGGAGLLGIQALGVLAMVAWVGATAAVLFAIIRSIAGLRVPREEEIRGLDIGEHGMEAYADFVPR